MKKSKSAGELKVRDSSRYARDMERSFAVIYHNLKRIQDDRQPQIKPRRRHSVPAMPSLASVQKLDETTSEQRRRESKETAPSPNLKKRRVSFSTLSQTIPISCSSRPEEQVPDLPETDSRDKASTRKASF